VGEREQTGIDWLTADWHDKERPRKRPRRNVLPDAYRRLPKADRQQVRAAIAAAMKGQPDGPNKEYWTTDLTVDAVKRKWHTTKFKPSPLKIVLVRRCCGEKFTHVLANKRYGQPVPPGRTAGTGSPQ
jgi:hypothetical protein